MYNACVYIVLPAWYLKQSGLVYRLFYQKNSTTAFV